jgi:predicted RNase H-like HicB family nuclease
MNSSKKRLKFTVEKTDTGFSAYCKEYPVYTTGNNFTELLSNAEEAISLYGEGLSDQIEDKEIDLEIDLQQFFQYYRVINAKFLAKRIGMNETLLSQYVQGTKKPSAKQTSKILNGIHEIGRELTNINLFI